MTAPQAAGVIHSDFEKGFIRAETVSTVYSCADGVSLIQIILLDAIHLQEIKRLMINKYSCKHLISGNFWLPFTIVWYVLCFLLQRMWWQNILLYVFAWRRWLFFLNFFFMKIARSYLRSTTLYIAVLFELYLINYFIDKFYCGIR